jgi:hypothetical protein
MLQRWKDARAARRAAWAERDRERAGYRERLALAHGMLDDLAYTVDRPTLAYLRRHLREKCGPEPSGYDPVKVVSQAVKELRDLAAAIERDRARDRRKAERIRRARQEPPKS